ncbi:cupredoxin family protein [Herbaspirillum sp. ST 5-3]|uniref:cupredoxin domain-containing protein n=1 Tax=Oxalobacteraceae TaxID=75682 RepID=UPI0010A48E89|nr:cupredoxin family protein [Herbaspirillum sp. ST 5-3]
MRNSYRRYLCAVILGYAGMVSAFAHGDHSGFDDLLIGKAGDPQNVTRTVNIDMSDEMRFKPDNITVERNETIRFVIVNKGRGPHEFMLGTARRLKEHNERMKSNPDTKLDAPYWISVAPGATGEIVWKFSQTGQIGFACFQPGHFDTGMKGDILVPVEAQKDAPRTVAR